MYIFVSLHSNRNGLKLKWLSKNIDVAMFTKKEISKGAVCAEKLVSSYRKTLQSKSKLNWNVHQLEYSQLDEYFREGRVSIAETDGYV